MNIGTRYGSDHREKEKETEKEEEKDKDKERDDDDDDDDDDNGDDDDDDDNDDDDDDDDDFFFFATPTLSVRTLKTVVVAVIARYRSSGRRPGFSCGSPQTASICEQRLASHGPQHSGLFLCA